MIIEKVNYPNDLKKLKQDEKKKLAEELREEIIQTVSKTGGHLASNLGVVELTIAILSAFDTPKDKVIWDVGHQTYSYKMLTGRKEKFSTLRQFGGLAGFPKTNESEYDAFDTGHSSTSISVGLGMARARDIKKEDYKIVSVIGDGALTGGMALEALNDVGSSNTNMLVILNDNEMSISKNVGGISLLLSKLRVRKAYVDTSIKGKNIINKIPLIGKPFVKLFQKAKRGIKQLVIPKMYFEDIGFKYVGPVDGHNIEELEKILKLCREQNGPILLHVLTKKGKGYKPAEENPDKFHSTSSFNIETGEKKSNGKKDYSKVFGDKIVELAKENSKIVAITAAMKDGTGLKDFAKQYPDRFFDVGIAEQHALGFAAGLAKEGLNPVVPLYSSFIQRGFDQVVHDIAIQNLPVVICLDRAGAVGKDGETHQGMLDMAILSAVPNLTIMAPKDFKELENMLEFAVNLNSPVVIRYPRGSEEISFEKNEIVKLGKAELLKEGTDISIIAIGKMVAKAQRVVKMLENDSIKAEIVNVRFLKPFDEEKIIDSIKKTKKVITLEDGTSAGGLGNKVEEAIINGKINNIKFHKFSYPDEFIVHGDVSQLEKKYGIDDKSIYDFCKQIIDDNNQYIKEIVTRGEKCIKNIKKKIKKMKKN